MHHRFYHLKKEIKENKPAYNGKLIEFQSKHKQAVGMISDVALAFPDSNILVVTDFWFGNNGMWKPLRQKLGDRVHMISRLRSNSTLFDEPPVPGKRKRGRSRKYGNRLGTPSSLSWEYRRREQEYTVNLYGKARTVLAYDRVVMLKNLKCRVRVVWVFRKTRWVALFSTDLILSVREIIEYYGVRWKIEACFKELKPRPEIQWRLQTTWNSA